MGLQPQGTAVLSMAKMRLSFLALLITFCCFIVGVWVQSDAFHRSTKCPDSPSQLSLLFNGVGVAAKAGGRGKGNM